MTELKTKINVLNSQFPSVLLRIILKISVKRVIHFCQYLNYLTTIGLIGNLININTIITSIFSFLSDKCWFSYSHYDYVSIRASLFYQYFCCFLLSYKTLLLIRLLSVLIVQITLLFCSFFFCFFMSLYITSLRQSFCSSFLSFSL